jgi:hypothetical protein
MIFCSEKGVSAVYHTLFNGLLRQGLRHEVWPEVLIRSSVTSNISWSVCSLNLTRLIRQTSDRTHNLEICPRIHDVKNAMNRKLSERCTYFKGMARFE